MVVIKVRKKNGDKMRANNKGFTLVELIATIVLLSIILSVGSYLITSIMKKSKEKDYEILINNINDAAETYYQECKHSGSSGPITCNLSSVALGDLVEYGYLNNNGVDENKNKLVNPTNNQDIGYCQISITYDKENGKIVVVPISGDNCPTIDNYKGIFS